MGIVGRFGVMAMTFFFGGGLRCKSRIRRRERSLHPFVENFIGNYLPVSTKRLT